MKFWYVDAFTCEPFKGNPAGVFIVEDFFTAPQMQNIAAELNLSETAFVKRLGVDHYHIRWFSPKDEAPLCGHATIAASHILKTEGLLTTNTIRYESLASELNVMCGEDFDYTLDFPEKPVVACELLDSLRKALGDVSIESVYKDDLIYMVVLDSAEAVQNLTPNLNKILKIDCRAVLVTAPGFGDYDFVSRYFAPRVGIPEDPVCGSAHCRLTPFWAERLGKKQMKAFQASDRTGVLDVSLTVNSRVLIKGEACTVAECALKIDLPNSLQQAA